MHTTMVNLGDTLINDALELTSEKYSSSAGVQNLKYMEPLYNQKSSTPIPDAS